jgi:hypothetical protein
LVARPADDDAAFGRGMIVAMPLLVLMALVWLAIFVT